MRAHTEHGNVVKVAVGDVRVSTLEQASEGVSLDAQRDKLRAYCKFNGIKLIDITSDAPRVPIIRERSLRRHERASCERIV